MKVRLVLTPFHRRHRSDADGVHTDSGKEGSICIISDTNQIDSNLTHDISATFSTLRSRALPADAACELDVLGEDRHPLGMNGNEVGVLKETNEVSLASLLQRKDGGRLEAKLRLEFECDLTHEALEREPTHQKEITK